MPTTGVDLSVAGILSLFSLCVDSFPVIQKHLAREKDLQILETKFNNQELRLITWGRACGLIDEFEYDTRLDEPELRSRIVATIECIQQVLCDEAELSKSYGLKRNKQLVTSQGMSLIQPGSSVSSTRPSVGSFFSQKRDQHLRGPATWEISDKMKFSELVKHLKDFNDDLESLTRQTSVPRIQRILVECEIEEVEDLDRLQIIEQAGQDDSDIVSDTASVRLGSVRDGSIRSFPSVRTDTASFVTARSNLSHPGNSTDSIPPAGVVSQRAGETEWFDIPKLIPTPPAR
jgi:hypothetical protein